MTDLSTGIIVTLCLIQALTMLTVLAWAMWLWAKLGRWKRFSGERNDGQPTHVSVSFEETK